MKRRYLAGGAILLTLAAGCNGSGGTANTDTGGKSTLVFQQADPAGDTLTYAGFTVSKPALDVTLIRGEYKGDSLILTLAFGGPVQPESAMADNSINGWIELDSDNDASTGDTPLTNLYGGTASLGIDYIIDLSATTASHARLYRTTTGVESSIGATFSGNTMTIRFVRDSAGITGPFGLVGLLGIAERPTDLLPNSGSIAVQGTSSRIVPGSPRATPPSADLRGWWHAQPWHTSR